MARTDVTGTTFVRARARTVILARPSMVLMGHMAASVIGVDIQTAAGLTIAENGFRGVVSRVSVT